MGKVVGNGDQGGEAKKGVVWEEGSSGKEGGSGVVVDSVSTNLKNNKNLFRIWHKITFKVGKILL